MLAIAMGFLAATVASVVAPTHPVYNPPLCKYLLGSLAVGALMAAYEAIKYPELPGWLSIWRSLQEHETPCNLDFVISFDERGISVLKPGGSTESALWDDLESLSVNPHDDWYFLWFGSYFLYLNVRGGSILIPAYSLGLEAFLRRLLELPGIDRERVEVLLREGTGIELETVTALLREGERDACVLWARDTEGLTTS